MQIQWKVKLQLWSFQRPLPTPWIWVQLSRPHLPWSVLSGCPGAQKLPGQGRGSARGGVGGEVPPVHPLSPAHLLDGE